MKKDALRTVLVAVNAQFAHTGLAVRSIAAFVRRETALDVSVMEATINHHERDVLRLLERRGADVYLFSCYIWNIEFILRLTRDLRLLRPDAFIGLGGPQVAYHARDCLLVNPQIDCVLTGEGEKTVCGLLGRLEKGEPLEDCPGIAYRGEGGEVASTPACAPISMDALAFAYPDLDALGHRLIYYESMRGCPFACSYCISSIDRGVRMRSLPLVFGDLSVFLAAGVRRVKLVDRTFNCDAPRARAIWAWIAEHDNGVTNFHFELSAELLDGETLAFLAGVRPGLFQFEIGVQSTHGATLEAIDRPANLPRLFERTGRLLAPGNIHVHLDLIAGLPYEDFAAFRRSFNDVYALRPHQLQLGFLKVLAGSKMEEMAARYGLAYSSNAPYEILRSRWIGFRELDTLRGIAQMVEAYHNSGRFSHTVAMLASEFTDPFSFYLALWHHYERVAADAPVSKTGYFDILGSFMRQEGIAITDRVQWMAKFDLLAHEKPRKLPSWIEVDASGKHREAIRGFFMNPENIAACLPGYEGESSKHIERTAHLEVFPFHPVTGQEGEVAAVFNYRRRDIAGRAQVCLLPLSSLG